MQQSKGHMGVMSSRQIALHRHIDANLEDPAPCGVSVSASS